ncbi:c-type cytochrome [Desulfuromonas versatilis]|uniref:C-type cytochrome n=1 Tax=Desulfuromonas versatilis TaxID=2802975 RepID=A0ABN6E2E4_9BACT|nr:hypothetical protein [Desulfuromonas versatilis]BCR05994.1 c-type cytochrome [Desulfuromonas versatilis]
MRQKRLITLVLAAALAMMLGGCGSNRDSGGDQTTAGTALGTDPATGIAFVGSATCINCHEGLSFSAEAVQGFLESRHVIHSTNINAASPASCLACHDPIGDGRGIEGLIDPANVPAQGLAAVGCENCHGPGGEHFGVGPVPTFSPDFEVCGKCHMALPNVPGFHPAGLNIIENYRQSAHADAARTSAPCFRCHSDIGFRQFVDGTRGLDDENLEVALAAEGPVGDAPIQCRTCHDQHRTGTLRVAEEQVRIGTDADGNRIYQTAFSSQFNLCTACHQAFLDETFNAALGVFEYTLFYDPANPEANDVPHHGDVNDPRIDSRGRTIVDTHFRFLDPADGVTVLIPGYNINAADDQACLNCHEVHATTIFAQANAAEIATQWAASGHADYLGEPFTHEFSDGACMKCHSGTEYARFVQGVAEEDLALAGGPRVIACVACHDLMAKNAAGEFELGATRTVNQVTFPSGAVRTLGDASNLCAECHQGRESGLTVANAIATTPGGPHRFLNRHYFAAAAIRFGTDVDAGFEYAGRTYLGENTYPGHPASLTTCIECHLQEGTANHTFAPDLARCQNCHVDSGTAFPGVLTSFENLGLPFGAVDVDYDGDGLGESFQAEIDGMEALLLAAIRNYAETVVGTPIAYAPGSYPYWFVDDNNNGIVDADETTRYSAFDDKLLAAAYNFHSNQDPCGDMHNYRYVLQTAYDSTDDLDDGILNNSVAGAAVAATRP